MSYSQFSLAQAQTTFNLTIAERVDLFADAPKLEISEHLRQTLDFNVPLALAVGTEKVRSELLIAPVLIELKRRHNYAFFSGVDFNVDAASGLMGYVDFLLSKDPEQLFVKAPVIVVVEAKKDDLNSGLGQCAATMVAASIFNERHNNEALPIAGAVTTGSIWKFLKLQGTSLSVDLEEYTIRDVGHVLGILGSHLR